MMGPGRFLWILLFAQVVSAEPWAPAFSTPARTGPYAEYMMGALPRQVFAPSELDERLAEAIKRTRSVKVVYNDVLGEGEQHWDTDPRYPYGRVNCIVWIRKLVAETLADSPADREKIMDHLRYFGGHAGYGMRKHFASRWMALDPGPLKKLDFSGCARSRRFTVELDLDHFLNVARYPCPLYRMDYKKFHVNYLGRRDFLKCAPRLETGYYFMFGIPSKGFIARWGKTSGPMGMVHGMVVHVGGSNQTERRGLAQGKGHRKVKIYHASVSQKKVVVEPLGKYVHQMRNRHRGYVVYRLDPAWDYRKMAPLSVHDHAIQSCEGEHSHKGRSRSTFDPL